MEWIYSMVSDPLYYNPTLYRKEKFKQLVNKFFSSKRIESCTIDELTKHVQQIDSSYSRKEMDIYLNQMQEDGNVMYAEGIIDLI